MYSSGIVGYKPRVTQPVKGFRVNPPMRKNFKLQCSFNLKRREDHALKCKDGYRLTLVVLSAKCNRSASIIHLSGPLDDRKRDNMLSGYSGTRWSRLRSAEKPSYPVASPSPTSRIWRVPFRGVYPADGTPININRLYPFFSPRVRRTC